MAERESPGRPEPHRARAGGGAVSGQCEFGSRHWFTFYGMPGIPSRSCMRGCRTPNPMLERRLKRIGWTMTDLEAFEVSIGLRQAEAQP